MTLKSMTGFASAESETSHYIGRCELKSVNAKGLDIRLRLPNPWEGFEPEIRALLGEKFQRGHIFLALEFDEKNKTSHLQINHAWFERLLSLEQENKARGLMPSSLANLLQVEGVLEKSAQKISPADRAAQKSAILALVNQAAAELEESRAREGMRIERVIKGQIAEITGYVQAARPQALVRSDRFQARLKSDLAMLLEGRNLLSDDRIAQEIAMLVVKTDIREELDRLDSHLEEAQKLLSEKDAVGRKFDFLCQELGREVNTLCAKSNDRDLTRTGLALKTIVEQLREQVQNIE